MGVNRGVATEVQARQHDDAHHARCDARKDIKGALLHRLKNDKGGQCQSQDQGSAL